jgi:fructokinase
MPLGAAEFGGTKIVLGVFDEGMHQVEQTTIPTKTPEDTMPAVVDYLKTRRIDALGIASFGPLNLRKSSKTFGSILNTPKLAWQKYPLLKTLRDALGVPCAIETDVNAAALAEAKMGAAKGLKNCLYVTIGTGIGGGLYTEGRLVHGLMHPEWGHVLLTRHEEDPMLHGVCPYHRNCAEGFASGPAMQARWGLPARDLPFDHRGWDMEAYYLGQLCVNALMAVSPEMIMLGGGVMHEGRLLGRVRAYVLRMVNGYIDQEQLPPMEEYIKSPALFPDSGLIGAALLSKAAASKRRKAV